MHGFTCHESSWKVEWIGHESQPYHAISPACNHCSTFLNRSADLHVIIGQYCELSLLSYSQKLHPNLDLYTHTIPFTQQTTLCFRFTHSSQCYTWETMNEWMNCTQPLIVLSSTHVRLRKIKGGDFRCQINGYNLDLFSLSSLLPPLSSISNLGEIN